MDGVSSGQTLPAHIPVAIVGAGQAGLSLSWYLRRAGIDHVVLERNEPGHAWRHERWDSFCLFTPNWQCQLPGYPYAGDNPDGFMPRDEIVAYLDGFARSFDPPVHSGVEVERLGARTLAGYTLRTSRGTFDADQVVVATGGYHDPVLPSSAAKLDPSIRQVLASDYRNPGALPPGAVLVVGTGQSGAQIAEDLHLAGRVVHLCVGAAPRVSRSYRGRDVVAWQHAMGHFDVPVDAHPLRERVRDRTNHYVGTRGGGHDIDLRRFAVAGMQLHGSLADISDGAARFAPDLAANLDNADAANATIKHEIDGFIAEQGIQAPVDDPYVAPWHPPADALESLDLRAAGITSIVWCAGFRPNYHWIDLPVTGPDGRPTHHRGVTPLPGLYFLGLPWLHSWGSGRMSGVGRDAAYLSERIVALSEGTVALSQGAGERATSGV
ncbi:MSMEG_0569 family flavin-dependent oxidoreductase [Lichenicola sp.]|uniref:MSMEG_0569 family flavin-dependent oxidoreductase n=1 Tax=Lichenicola sp. TaxID=2804529 RepID=UPI003AFFCF74